MTDFDELTDKCPMPLGKHKGIPMEDVPASYLIWYRENAKSPDKRLMEYIIDNWDVLKRER